MGADGSPRLLSHGLGFRVLDFRVLGVGFRVCFKGFLGFRV